MTITDMTSRQREGGEVRDRRGADAGCPTVQCPTVQCPTVQCLARRVAGPVAAAIGLVLVHLAVVAGVRVPFLGPALGFWFLVVQPVLLLSGMSIWRGTSSLERLGHSVGGVLLALLVGGLGLNTVLPPLGVSRPLDPIPVLLSGDVLLLVLFALRRRHRGEALLPGGLIGSVIGLAVRERRLLAASALCVIGAVAGAIRLNNDAGGQVSLVALSGVLATLVLLLVWRDAVREEVIGTALYLLSLAVLFMTSLRGWFVTGHDIQREYRVFQLTVAHGRWDMSWFQDAYNACLSITVLPTQLAHLVQVDDPYVFKVFFQLVAAACPVLVYLIARRHWSRAVGVLAAVYFVGFPTFLNDLPFLNRQGTAFLFVGVAVLAISHPTWTPRLRRGVLLAAGVGVELAHYSTMYVLLGVLGLTWLADRTGTLVRRRRRRVTGAGPDAVSWAGPTRTVGAGTLAALTAVTVAWGGLVTGTGRSAVDVAAAAVSGLTGHSTGARSGVVSYSLLGGLTGRAEPAQKTLDDYRRATLADRSGGAAEAYLPTSLVSRYPTTAVEAARPLPLTRAGQVLDDAGLPVEGLNTVLRRAAAKGEQVFAAVGLIGVLAVRRRRRQVGREFLLLGVGSLGIVAVVTVMPNLSVEYGVLRAFQEALVVVAPLLVAGSLMVFRRLGERWGPRVAAAVCFGFFASTSGLVPQILGGYPAQLALNNEGVSYDVYYTHPEELAAVNWLRGRPGVLPDGVQASFHPDRFVIMPPSDIGGGQLVTNIYPTTIRKDSWLLLDSSTVRTGRSSVFANGDVIAYRYPLEVLEQGKNRVFDNGGAQIYR